MNTIYYVTKPLADLWNRYLNDPNFQDLTSIRGGSSGGNDWHTKYLRSERDRVNSEFNDLSKRFNEEPELLDVLWDNKLRLTVLAGLERLFAIR